MSALMTDVVEGSVTPSVANAAVNAGGKMLKAVELQLKYGREGSGGGPRTLTLCGGAEPEPAALPGRKRAG